MFSGIFSPLFVISLAILSSNEIDIPFPFASTSIGMFRFKLLANERLFNLKWPEEVSTALDKIKLKLTFNKIHTIYKNCFYITGRKSPWTVKHFTSIQFFVHTNSFRLTSFPMPKGKKRKNSESCSHFKLMTILIMLMIFYHI